MSLPVYTITYVEPKPGWKGGYIVKGERLKNGFWHPTANDCVKYCKSVFNDNDGCSVEVYDKEGKLHNTITIRGNVRALPSGA